MLLRSGEVIVRTAETRDVAELDELYSQACGYLKFDTERPLVKPSGCLSGLDLPEGGRPENYELLCLLVGGMIIGYMSLYREYPSKRSVDITLMYIGEPARRKGFGSAALDGVCRYFYEADYGRITAHASLRNWGALRFLRRGGFDRVVALDAPNEAADGGYGGITLGLVLNFDRLF